jgi:integrase
LYCNVNKAIELYERHLRSADLAENTIKNKLQPLRLALPVWGSVDVKRLNAQDIDNLFSHYQWGPRTRNLYLGVLRQFFTWCRHNRYAPREFDPTLAWRNRSIPKIERLRVPVHRFPELLDATQHPRDRAAVALGLYTFLRGSELQTLQIQDVDFSASLLHIYRHKTSEEDRLPICMELREELERWLDWYRRDQGRLEPNWFLVPSKKPNHITWVDGKRVLISDTPPLRPERKMSHPYRPAKRALEALGLDAKGEGEHTLRRSGARALLDALREEGTDSALLRVGAMLGHKDTRVTAHYVGLHMEREQRNELLAGKRMFPAAQGATGTNLRLVR